MTAAAPTVSLIVLTYNWPQALALVLKSIGEQRLLPDEVIIADDGSMAETTSLIKCYQKKFPVPLLHAWQADEGFRAAQARNNGVAHSQGDYLIFIDGDTILHPCFIANHLRFATVGHFTVGSRVLLSNTATQAAFRQNNFRFSWQKTPARNKLNAVYHRVLAKCYAKPVRQPIERLIFKVRSCNMGVWRTDFEVVNGFNQRFVGWGREDSELALRLFKKGLGMRRLKFSAIQYHLFHRENDRSRLHDNDEILSQMMMAKRYRCRHGLLQLSSKENNDN